MKIVNLKLGGWVKVGEDVYVRLNSIFGKRCHIGVQAPLDKLVLRGELVAKVEEGESRADGDKADGETRGPKGGVRP